MSALLNILGVALILPNAALALFFLAVGFVAGQQTLGTLLKSLWALLPSVEYLPYITAAVLAGLVLGIAVMIRFTFVLPLLIVALGGASLAFIGWTVGARELATNPLGWIGVLGVAAGGWQFWRVTMGPPA